MTEKMPIEENCVARSCAKYFLFEHLGGVKGEGLE